MAKLTMVQAINQALAQEMERDNTVLLFGEDVGVDGGVFRVTEGLKKQFGERVMDTPISESGLVGMAIGMSVAGLKPIVEIQFDGFTPPAFDQLYSHATRLRTRSRGRFKSHIVVRFPYGGGVRALEHHSDSPEAYFVHMPGIKVVIPSGPYEAKGLLTSAIRDPDPVIFMEAKKIYRSIKEEVPENQYTIPLGKANIVQEGSDISIFSYGSMLHVAKAATEAVQGRYSAEVVDLRTLSPLDIETIRRSVKKTGRAIVLHEAPRSCGMGAEVAAVIAEKEMSSLKAPVIRITGWDVVMPLPRLENYYLPNAKQVVKAIGKLMQYK